MMLFILVHLSKSQEHPEAGRKDQEAYPQSITISMVAAAASFLEPQRRLPKGGRARVPKNLEQKTPDFIQSWFPVPKHRCPDLKTYLSTLSRKPSTSKSLSIFCKLLPAHQSNRMEKVALESAYKMSTCFNASTIVNKLLSKQFSPFLLHTSGEVIVLLVQALICSLLQAQPKWHATKSCQALSSHLLPRKVIDAQSNFTAQYSIYIPFCARLCET